MNNKTTASHNGFQPTEADELRLTVAELNQSIAYLSKMVLQLQRSMNENKSPSKTPVQAKDTIPDTVH